MNQNESVESLKSKLLIFEQQKEQLQKEFDKIKAEWTEERQQLKNTLSQVQKSSAEKIKKLEETNTTIEEKLFFLQKITETQETYQTNSTLLMKTIKEEYVLKRSILDNRIEKLKEFIENIRATFDFIKFKCNVNIEETIKKIEDRIFQEIQRQNTKDDELKQEFSKELKEIVKKYEFQIKELDENVFNKEKEIENLNNKLINNEKLLEEIKISDTEIMDTLKKQLDYQTKINFEQKQEFSKILENLEQKGELYEKTIKESKETIEKQGEIIKNFENLLGNEKAEKKHLEIYKNSLETQKNLIEKQKISLENQLNSLDSQNNSLENQIKSLENDKIQLKNGIDELERKIQGIGEDFKKNQELLNKDIEMKQNEIILLTKDKTSLETENNHSKEKLNSQEKTLKDSEEKRNKAITLINMQDNEINSLKNTVFKLNTQIDALNKNIADLNHIVKDLEGKQKESSILMNSKENEINSLITQKNNTIETFTKTIEDLKQENSKLTQNLNNLLKKYDDYEESLKMKDVAIKEAEEKASKQMQIINSFENELNSFQSFNIELNKTNENLMNTIKILENELELNNKKQENLRKSYENNIHDLEEQNISKVQTIQELQQSVKDCENRIKAQLDLIKSLENKGNDIEISNKIEELLIKNEDLTQEIKGLLLNNEAIIKKNEEILKENEKLKNENGNKNIEIEDLKEIFNTLQENQQEHLLRLISKSAEKLLNISKIKEKEKNENLQKLKEIEKEVEAYTPKPTFKSPKLDLILKQQRALIEEIKQKTQSERFKVKEFEMNSGEIEEIEEIKGRIQKKIEEKKTKLEEKREAEIKRDILYFDRKYLELLESKKKENEGFLKTLEELEEDNGFLKEIIKTKDFELFYLKSEFNNKNSDFKLMLGSSKKEIETLKNYLINMRLYIINEAISFKKDIVSIKQAIFQKLSDKKISLEEKKIIVELFNEKLHFFEEKLRKINEKIDNHSEKTEKILMKIQVFTMKFKILIGKYQEYYKNPEILSMRTNLFQKFLKLYRIFLTKQGIPSDQLQWKMWEDNANPLLFLEISLQENANRLKKEDISNFTNMIGISLVRMMEICKTIAKILKNFLVIDHRYPHQFNEIKANFIKFVNFIEENNEKIMDYHDDKRDNQRVLEKFLDGFDLLNAFIKEIHDYRKGLLIISNKTKKNFLELNIVRENAIFKEILLKDFERIKKVDKLNSIIQKNGLYENIESDEDDFEEVKEKTSNLLNKHLF